MGKKSISRRIINIGDIELSGQSPSLLKEDLGDSDDEVASPIHHKQSTEQKLIEQSVRYCYFIYYAHVSVCIANVNLIA